MALFYYYGIASLLFYTFIMTSCLGAVAAQLHGTPTAGMRAARIMEQPATPFTLLDLTRRDGQ